MQDDAALVQSMRSGRPEGASQLYERHVRLVRALVLRWMGPDTEVDDVVHDVFIRAIESLPRLRDPRALRSWLAGIAVRTARIRLQRRGRQRWLRFRAPEEVPEVATAWNASAGEAVGQVDAILRGMDADERAAFLLCRVHGLSLEDAARTSTTSLATLRRRLARAEAKFFARAKSRPVLAEWIHGAR